MQLITTSSLSLHHEAGRVPLMREKEFRDFVADIRTRGIRVPLALLPGTTTILDGRCRWLAATELGIPEVPIEDAILNGEDPVIYLLRAASSRRHLTDDQRAMLAEEERKIQSAKAKSERSRKGRTRQPLVDVADKPSEPAPRIDTRRDAAAAHNVNERRVRQAQKVSQANPELAEQVKAGDVKLIQAVRTIQKEERRQAMQAAAEQAAAIGGPLSSLWELRQGDCLEELRTLRIGCAALVFCDPPYNIGVDYGSGTSADSLQTVAYLQWCSRWLAECYRILKPNGSFWLLINHENAAALEMLIRGTPALQFPNEVVSGQQAFHIRARITWYETFGVNTANNFNRCSRRLFYCVKDPKSFVFHPEAVNRLSDRQAKYADRRADPDGKIWDDMWSIPRLMGTSRERIPDFPTQLPLELLSPIVGCVTNPGDLVVDPFSGSATTGIAAITSTRKYLGIELSEKFVEVSRLRLQAADAGDKS